MDFVDFKTTKKLSSIMNALQNEVFSEAREEQKWMYQDGLDFTKNDQTAVE